MKKEDKERVVGELTERLKASETMLVADYRGLTMPQIDELRSKLLESGARFTVVKNTLTRRAAEAAGADALLALLEGPSAIAFLEADGDMVAAAKALADMARDSKVLAIRGGVMQGRSVTAEEVETLAKLPPIDVLRGQVLGAIVAPLTAFARPRDRAAAEPARPDRRPDRAARRRATPQRSPVDGRARGGTGRRGDPGRGRGAEPTEADATASAAQRPESTDTEETE